MKLVNHWLDQAWHCPSPFFNARPDPEDISLLLIHCIALPPKTYGGRYIEDFFQGRLDQRLHPYFATLETLQVSAHLLIRRTGALVQFVGFDQRAWHAGQSCYQGRSQCNDFSIGIEMEGSEDQPYTQVQYRQLIDVTRLLLDAYPRLTPERICGHQDVAPGRKTDPGSCFDWSAYLDRLHP